LPPMDALKKTEVAAENPAQTPEPSPETPAYAVNWVQTQPPAPSALDSLTWLVFMDPLGLGRQIVTQLKGADHRVFEVRPGKSFRRVGKADYLVNPDSRADFDLLITDIAKRGFVPQKVVHLWALSDASASSSPAQTLSLCFTSLMHLAASFYERGASDVDIAVVSGELQGGGVSNPLEAVLLGPVRAIPKRFRGVVCRSLQCDPSAQGLSHAAVQIIAEHCSPFSDSVVAFRGGERWIQTVDRWQVPSDPPAGPWRNSGVYFIANALSPFALALSEILLRNFQARLVLADSLDLPPSSEWAQAGANPSTPETARQSISRLRKLQSLGGEILYLSANPARSDRFVPLAEAVRAKFPELNGIILSAPLGQSLRAPSSSPADVAGFLAPLAADALALKSAFASLTPEFVAVASRENPFPLAADLAASAAAGAFFDSLASAFHGAAPYSIHFDSPTSGSLSLPLPSSEEEAGVFFRACSTLSPSILVVTSAALLASLPPSRRSAVSSSAAASDVESVVASWWRDLLSLDSVGLDDDFFELGGHSLIAVQLFSMVKKTYGLDLVLSTVFEVRTVRQLAQLIRDSRKLAAPQHKPWSPLVPIQPNGSRAPLFVISGMGGNVIKFNTLAFHLGADQPMYGLLPRGLDGNAAFHSRIEDVAADYVQAILERQPDGPYHLVGYSFGGIVAFETAQQLLAKGKDVELLAFFDTLEWHYGEKVDKSLRLSERLEEIKEHASAILFGKDRIGYIRTRVDARIARLRQGLRKFSGSPAPANPESIEEANTNIAFNYHPAKYPGKLTLFRSTNRTAMEGDDPYLGWGDYVSGGIDVCPIPSNHFNILKDPFVQSVAASLRARITEKSPANS